MAWLLLTVYYKGMPGIGICQWGEQRGQAMTKICALIRKTAELAMAIVLVTGNVALASPVYSGTVAGLFKDPVFIGQYIQTNGTLSAVVNNATTAVYSGMGTNSIQWGACPEGLPPTGCGDNGGAARYSELSFVGNTFAGVPADTEFLLGTLIYTNGTSRLSTVIFGVTAEITVTLEGGGTVDSKVTAAQLWSTANRPVTTPADTLWNADFVYFLADDISFNVLEGGTASADVYGKIVGDPYLEVTTLVANDANGYIGHGPSDYVPEPATLALLGLGLAGLGFSRRKR